MDRRTFLSMMLHGSLIPLFAPGRASQILICQDVTMPLDALPNHSVPRVTVVGVGHLGAANARLLARSKPQIACHAIFFGQSRPDPTNFDGLFKSIQSSNLLFILTAYDDSFCSSVASACAEAAQVAGVPVVNIVPQQQNSADMTALSGTTFSVSEHVAARHLVTTITHLVASPSFVGIDFGDVKAIVQSGARGMLGSGSAAGKDRGQKACLLALDSLRYQGFYAHQCRGALACLYGAPSMVMDDYDQALTTLLNYFPKEHNIVFGCIVDEQLGSDVRVTIAAVT